MPRETRRQMFGWSRRSRTRRAALVTIAAAGLLALPATASACSCFYYGSLVWPQDGGTLPANGSLVFSASCSATFFADATTFEAWVDGQPATLVADDPSVMTGVGFKLDPAPAPGATVELSNCGPEPDCADEADPESGLQFVTFTVGEPDTTPPAAPLLAPIDYEIVEVPLECGENPTPARDWSVRIDGDGPADEPRVYIVDLAPEDDDDPTVAHTFAMGGDTVDLVIQRLTEDAGEEVCATVRTFDLAGNEADPVSSCRKLRRGETLGCACTASDDAGGPTGLLALFGLVALARRRR